MPDYERRPDGAVVQRLPVGEDMVILHADNIRKERTGIHATFTIALNTGILGYDTFNVERSEERGRLANASHKMFPALMQSLIPAQQLRHHLDVFAHGLWRFHVGQNAAELTAGNMDQPSARFMLPPYCAEEMGTVLFGPPGAGKSWVTMALAVSLTYGVNSVWPNVSEGIVPLFINLERSRSSVSARLAGVNRALGLDPNLGLLCLHGRGKSLNDMMEPIRRAIREEGVNFLFLDSISRGGFGDLKEDQTANKWLDALNSFGVGWFAIGHTTRSDDSHLFGSMMGDAGADFMFSLKSEDRPNNTLGVMVSMTKSNHTKRLKPETLALEFDDGDHLHKIRQAHRFEFPTLTDSSDEPMHDKLVAYLEETTEATATEMARDLGYNRATVSSWVNANPVFTRGQKTGKEQPWRLVDGYKTLIKP